MTEVAGNIKPTPFYPGTLFRPGVPYTHSGTSEWTGLDRRTAADVSFNQRSRMRSAYYHADVSPRTSGRIGQWRGYARGCIQLKQFKN
ncbi:hypothetical protein NQ318_006283 [Aromia moschata]|uniref:Uncharacterized protein n=1 Tax=Aromia moschata TaxID=1265417 RepID=A0AAV8YY95_9CUCU|nr:hypothetical protein NQ318_006283 [Aromia moschata]